MASPSEATSSGTDIKAARRGESRDAVSSIFRNAVTRVTGRRQMFLSARHRNTKALLKACHQRACVAERNGEGKHRWRADTTVSSVLLLRSVAEELGNQRAAYASGTDEGRRSCWFLRASTGERILLFDEPFFRDRNRTDADRVSWQEVKRDVFYRYLSELGERSRAVARELAVRLEISRVYAGLTVRPVTYGRLAEALRAAGTFSAAAASADTAPSFWSLPCFADDDHANAPIESLDRFFRVDCGCEFDSEQLREFGAALEEERLPVAVGGARGPGSGVSVSSSRRMPSSASGSQVAFVGSSRAAPAVAAAAGALAGASTPASTPPPAAVEAAAAAVGVGPPPWMTPLLDAASGDRATASWARQSFEAAAACAVPRQQEQHEEQDSVPRDRYDVACALYAELLQRLPTAAPVVPGSAAALVLVEARKALRYARREQALRTCCASRRGLGSAVALISPEAFAAQVQQLSARCYSNRVPPLAADLPSSLSYASVLHALEENHGGQGGDLPSGMYDAVATVREVQLLHDVGFNGRLSAAFLRDEMRARGAQRDQVHLGDVVPLLDQRDPHAVGIADRGVYERALACRAGGGGDDDDAAAGMPAAVAGRLYAHATVGMVRDALTVADVPNMRCALYKYGPLLLTLPVYASPDGDDGDGDAQFWVPSSSGVGPRGYHTVVVIGYEDNPTGGWITFRNSLGRDWGFAGTDRIPYGALFRPTHHIVALIDDAPLRRSQASGDPLKWLSPMQHHPSTTAVSKDDEVARLRQYAGYLRRKLGVGTR